ncbi:MAG TPA: hypothetical protein VKJ65_04880, partial [Phycisphaerae bacterium]|nr:hypothetical protein [Phycisphaerae bacterium]
KFRRCNPTAIIDYCCGIGGDMLALADVAPVLAVELSPIRALLAARNAIHTTHRWPALVVQADVATQFSRPQPGVVFHIDPARRIGPKRSAEYSLMHPGPMVIQRVINVLQDGAVKLSPAADFSSLPDGHLELISEDGVVVQAILWTGRMAQPMESGTHTATVLSRRRSAWSLTGKPAAVAILHEPQQWVFEIDGAVLRAGLSVALCAALGIQPISADGGYATGPEAINHPALTGFKIFGSLPYSQRAVAAALRSKSSSASSGKRAVVEVKTRGGLGLDTDKLSKSWSACTTRNCTVLIYRGVHGITAAIAEREIRE